MRIKNGFILRKIADQYMAVPVGARTRELHGMIAMNETAAFLWEKMSEECTEDDLSQALLDTYEIDTEKSKEVVQRFIDMLKKEGVLEDA